MTDSDSESDDSQPYFTDAREQFEDLIEREETLSTPVQGLRDEDGAPADESLRESPSARGAASGKDHEISEVWDDDIIHHEEWRPTLPFIPEGEVALFAAGESLSKGGDSPDQRVDSPPYALMSQLASKEMLECRISGLEVALEFGQDELDALADALASSGGHAKAVIRYAEICKSITSAFVSSAQSLSQSSNGMLSSHTALLSKSASSHSMMRRDSLSSTVSSQGVPGECAQCCQLSDSLEQLREHCASQEQTVSAASRMLAASQAVGKNLAHVVDTLLSASRASLQMTELLESRGVGLQTAVTSMHRELDRLSGHLGIVLVGRGRGGGQHKGDGAGVEEGEYVGYWKGGAQAVEGIMLGADNEVMLRGEDDAAAPFVAESRSSSSASMDKASREKASASVLGSKSRSLGSGTDHDNNATSSSSSSHYYKSNYNNNKHSRSRSLPTEQELEDEVSSRLETARVGDGGGPARGGWPGAQAPLPDRDVGGMAWDIARDSPGSRGSSESGSSSSPSFGSNNLINNINDNNDSPTQSKGNKASPAQGSRRGHSAGEPSAGSGGNRAIPLVGRGGGVGAASPEPGGDPARLSLRVLAGGSGLTSSPRVGVKLGDLGWTGGPVSGGTATDVGSGDRICGGGDRSGGGGDKNGDGSGAGGVTTGADQPGVSPPGTQLLAGSPRRAAGAGGGGARSGSGPQSSGSSLPPAGPGPGGVKKSVAQEAEDKASLLIKLRGGVVSPAGRLANPALLRTRSDSSAFGGGGPRPGASGSSSKSLAGGSGSGDGGGGAGNGSAVATGPASVTAMVPNPGVRDGSGNEASSSFAAGGTSGGNSSAVGITKGGSGQWSLSVPEYKAGDGPGGADYVPDPGSPSLSGFYRDRAVRDRLGMLAPGEDLHLLSGALVRQRQRLKGLLAEADGWLLSP